MDGQFPIKANIDFKADLTEIVRIFGKGIGHLVHLACGRWVANLAKYKALTEAQTQKEKERILSDQYDFKEGVLAPLLQAFPENSERMPPYAPLQLEKEQEMHNLAGNLCVAYDMLKGTPDDQVADAQVDPDFFARWRREAIVIGNKDLQTIWGRILAEEIKQPKSFSFRTLDVIKNITKEEAEAFSKAARFVMNSTFLVVNQQKKVHPEGLSTGIVITLQDCGLVLEAGKEYTPNGRLDSPLRFYGLFNECLLLNHAPEQCFSLPGAPLSTAGRDIYKILSNHHKLSNEDFRYIRESAKDGSKLAFHPQTKEGRTNLNVRLD